MSRTLAYDATLGVLTLTVEGGETNYGLDELAHAYGPLVRLFRVWKFGAGGPYAVTLAGGAAGCTCPGFTYRGGCRHADALAALAAAGRLG